MLWYAYLIGLTPAWLFFIRGLTVLFIKEEYRAKPPYYGELFMASIFASLVFWFYPLVLPALWFTLDVRRDRR